ncbi:MAG: hypothetical protein HKM92_08790 [Arenibacter sp.]|nr:hypothetical protein [Arenibacter sp.]
METAIKYPEELRIEAIDRQIRAYFEDNRRKSEKTGEKVGCICGKPPVSCPCGIETKGLKSLGSEFWGFPVDINPVTGRKREIWG